jgi:ankyrin repeat protein
VKLVGVTTLAKSLVTLIASLALFCEVGVAVAISPLDEQLHEAAEQGNLSLVKSLLDKGADPRAKDIAGRTALMWAAVGPERPDIIEADSTGKQEVENKETVSNHDDAERLEVVKLLLDKGPELEAGDARGRTALILAAAAGDSEIVKLLLDRGANVKAADRDGQTALLVAAGECANECYLEIMGLLLDKGADVNAKDSLGETALVEDGTEPDCANP